MSRPMALRAVAAITAVLVLAAAGVALDERNEAAESTVVGYFADASPLDPGSEVRAAGVRVGNVQEIALENGRARVTFTVDPVVLPLHRDATMTLRPVNLLGEHYVELDAGSPGKPFMQDPLVPVSRTESSVDLEDILNTLDDPTSTALATLVTTLGEGTHGSGDEAAAAIKALAPAMRRAGELGRVLNEQNAALNELVDRLAPVAKALAADDGNTLDRLVTSTERTLSTVAANRDALDATIAELPGMLTDARRTLRELTGVSSAATPTLRSIRPVTDNLTEITGELQRFADAADPALASLRPVLKHAEKLLRQAAPVAAQLREAGPDLRTTAENLRPVGDVLLNQHLGDLMAFVKKWSLSTNGRDALSHYFRGVAWVTPETLQDLSSSILPNKGKADALPVGQENQLPAPDALLPERPSGSATGLTQQQEQSMLGQLLGGR